MSEKIVKQGRDWILYDSRTLDQPPESRWFEPRYWREANALDGAARGRGAVHFFSHRGQRWALRHCHRGGLVGRLISDRYLYTGQARVRSFAEWRLLKRLEEMDLPAPEPVAARYRRSGLWYRADLITRRLTHDATLAEALHAPAPPTGGQWRAVGRTIRRFHDAGICHADLNAHNILLAGETVYLIDFDRGSIRAPGAWQAANLKRLERSLRKLTPDKSEADLSAGWAALLAAYRPPRSDHDLTQR